MSRWQQLRARLARKAWSIVGRRVVAPLLVDGKDNALCGGGLEGHELDHIQSNGELASPASIAVAGAGFEAFAPFPDGTDVRVWTFTAGVSFRAMHAITDDGRVLTGPNDDFSRMWVAGRGVERGGRRLKGRCFFLSNSWVDNYYHWLVMTLPLLEHYRTTCGAGAADWYYVGNGGLTAFQRETLQLAGVPLERVILGPCRAEECIVAVRHYFSRSGLLFRTRSEIEFPRRLVPCRGPAARRRLYVRRGAGKNRRRIANEDEVLAQLTNHGFEPVTMDGLSVRDQAQLFSDAECIVAMHGAALANLAFARDGAALVEFFPGSYREVSHFATAAHRRLCYAALGTEFGAGGSHVGLQLLQAALESVAIAGAPADTPSLH